MTYLCNNFVNVKISCMSLIGGNCKTFVMNIPLILPNGKTLDLNFCNFRCIVASKVQSTMDISLIMMNLIFGHMFYD
jgi:hypothetical protein